MYSTSKYKLYKLYSPSFTLTLQALLHKLTPQALLHKLHSTIRVACDALLQRNHGNLLAPRKVRLCAFGRRIFLESIAVGLVGARVVHGELALCLVPPPKAEARGGARTTRGEAEFQGAPELPLLLQRTRGR